MAEIGIEMSDPAILFGDNVAAKTWSENKQSMRRAKQIELRHHFVKNCIDGDIVKPCMLRPKIIYPMDSRSRSTELRLRGSERRLALEQPSSFNSNARRSLRTIIHRELITE